MKYTHIFSCLTLLLILSFCHMAQAIDLQLCYAASLATAFVGGSVTVPLTYCYAVQHRRERDYTNFITTHPDYYKGQYAKECISLCRVVATHNGPITIILEPCRLKGTDSQTPACFFNPRGGTYRLLDATSTVTHNYTQLLYEYKEQLFAQYNEQEQQGAMVPYDHAQHGNMLDPEAHVFTEGPEDDAGSDAGNVPRVDKTIPFAPAALQVVTLSKDQADYIVRQAESTEELWRTACDLQQQKDQPLVGSTKRMVLLAALGGGVGTMAAVAVAVLLECNK